MHKSHLFILLILSFHLSFAGTAQIKVIYGEDNREDVSEVANPLYLQLSLSTAGMIKPEDLVELNNEQYSVAGKSLEEAGICAEERFSHQKTAASCSGFLVDKNKIVTAGHCIRSQADCDRYLWAFDYKVTATSDTEVVLDKKQVYKCRKIISQKLDRDSEADYALIELDRQVSDRSPLNFRRKGKPQVGESLVVIGHPSGLPTKIADGAIVRDVNDVFLTANLDTYGGNSGSAVFNATTGMVEGILVRGETDYIYDDVRDCRVSNVLANDAGDGEEVTLITIVEGLDRVVGKPPKPPVVVPPKPTEPEEPSQPVRLSWWQRLLRYLFGA